MKDKKRLSLYELISRLLADYFKTTKDFVALINAEAQLAAMGLVKIVLLSFILRALLISTWLTISVGLAFYLATIQKSVLLSFVEMILLNFTLIVFVGLSIVKMKKNFLFLATRRQLQFLGMTSEDRKVD